MKMNIHTLLNACLKIDSFRKYKYILKKQIFFLAKTQINKAHILLIRSICYVLTYIIRPSVSLRKKLNFISGKRTFIPRQGDIYIATYPRSGTTWLQMILHQLSSNGELNFNHISEIMPYYERSFYINRDLNNLPSPRIFKTHLQYQDIYQKDAKYIYMERDGRDVITSFFHMHKTHLGFKGTFKDFFKLFMVGKLKSGSWFEHVAQWKEHANDFNVLYLCYEDLIDDLEGSIHKIANFCGYRIDLDRYPIILERSSFQYMKAHESKFDHITEITTEMGLTPNSFIRNGKAGTWKELLDVDQLIVFEQAVSDRSKNQA